MRAACTLGTSPCSAIATRQASSTRACAALAASPVTRSQKYCVNESEPIRSRHRSRPRTTIVSALAVLIALARSFVGPIFKVALPAMQLIGPTLLWTPARRPYNLQKQRRRSAHAAPRLEPCGCVLPRAPRERCGGADGVPGQADPGAGALRARRPHRRGG